MDGGLEESDVYSRFMIYDKAFCDCFLYYDEPNKIIHVLDNYTVGNRTVTNAIEDIQPNILDSLKLLDPVESYTWFLYGTDCVISDFKNGDFKFIPHENELVNETLLTWMKRMYYRSFK